MKKLLFAACLSTALFLTNVNADTKAYVGVELSSGVTQRSASGGWRGNPSDNFNDTKFIVGKGVGEDNYIQLYYNSTKYDSNVSAQGVGSLFDKSLKSKELGIEWLKKVPFENNVSPFIKVGAGIASMKLANGVSNDNYATAISLTLGTGLDINVNDSFSILTGFDYNFKNYRSFNVYDNLGNEDRLKLTQNSFKIYLGANLKF